MLDVLIKNGKVVDGTGKPWFYGDVGIVGDEIVKIGKVEEEAKRVIDARGKVVSPGFCDPHAHPDYKCAMKAFEKDWSFSNWLLQGVTTFIGSNCGLGVIPSEAWKSLVSSKLGFPREVLTDIKWDTVEDYVKLANKIGLGPNYVLFAGHWTLRQAVLPTYPGYKTITKAQLQEMKDLLEEQMRAGMFGLSVGLSYGSCRYAEKSELVELAEVVAKYDGILNFHIREGYSQEAHISFGLREAIDIARKTGVPVQIAHLYSGEKPEEGKTPPVLKFIEEARKEGIDVTFDCTPYPSHKFGTELMYNILIAPPPHVAESAEELAKSWKDPEFREMVYQEMLNVGDKCPYDYVHSALLSPDCILTNTDDPDIEGLTLGEVARVEGITSNMVTGDRRDILSLLVKRAVEGRKGAVTMGGLQEGYLGNAILNDSPYSMPGSDGFMGERNAYGSFARYFEDRVNRGVSLEEIVRHMTSLPARRYVFDRGLLAIGQKADIVVFDPDNFKDNTTMADAAKKPSGIDFVLVNGSVVVENGEMTDARPGKILLKR